MTTEDLKQAGKTLREMLAQTPRDPLLIYNLGVVHSKLGEDAQAVEYLSAALAIEPSLAEAHVALGDIHARLGQGAAAIAAYQAAIAANPGLVDAHNNLAGVYMAAGDVAAGLDHYLVAHRLAPRMSVVLQNIVRTLVQLGRATEAIPFAERLLVAEPSSAHATQLANLLRQTDSEAAADVLFASVLAQQPDAALLAFIGQLFVQLGQRENGIAAYHMSAYARPLDVITNTADVPRWVLDNPYTSANPSPRYGELIAQYKMLHDAAKAQGEGQMFEGFVGFSIVAPYIRAFARKLGAATMLDYGGGRGAQYGLGEITVGQQRYTSSLDYLGLREAVCFDPGFDAQLPPGNFDMVICVDALEHCDRADLPWIIKGLFARARLGVFANIACYPARKILPNGENAHCTIEEAPWWMGLFQAAAREFPDVAYQVLVSKDIQQASRVAFGRMVRE